MIDSQKRSVIELSSDHDISEVAEAWKQWFTGPLSADQLGRLGWGRMFGYVGYVEGNQEFRSEFSDELVDQIRELTYILGRSTYFSNHYFSGHGILAGLEKVMIDMDPNGSRGVGNDARKVLDYLLSFGKPLLVFSGRGYHAYLWLPNIYRVRDQELAKRIMDELVKGLGLEKLRLHNVKIDLNPTRIPKSLARIPFTISHKTGKRVIPLDYDLRPIAPESFSINEYVRGALPTDLVNEAIETAKLLRSYEIVKARLKGEHEKLTPKGYRYIKEVLEKGLPDGRKRFIWLCASRYLVNVRKLPSEAAVTIIEEFVERSERLPNFKGDGKVTTSYIRYQVSKAARDRKLPPKLSTLENMDPELVALIKEILGKPIKYEGGRRPSSRQVVVGAGPNPYAARVLEFVRETGLEEFSYDDFKRWLEQREGRLLNASEWQGWERRLRQLVSEGLLGRKYLVNGRWVDYGTEQVTAPPSKAVRFYLARK